MLRTAARTLPTQCLRAQGRGVASLSRIQSRALLRVSGPDARQFLQGMTTNDVEGLTESSQSSFTVFQNAKGRILFDALLSLVRREGDDDTFLLDVPADMRSVVWKHLRLYRLRSKVGLDWMDGLAVWQASGAGAPGAEDIGAGLAAGARGADPESPDFALAVADPRLPALGYRVYVAAGDGDGDGAEAASDILGTPQGASTGSEDDFTARRLLHGVAEGREMEGGIALEYAAECLNGVDFHKGCYVGQELVARTHFKGLLRKRAMPVLLLPGGTPCDGGPRCVDDVLDGEGELVVDGHWVRRDGTGAEAPAEAAVAPTTAARRTGKLRATAPGTNIGLALLRLEQAIGEDGEPQPLVVSWREGGEGDEGEEGKGGEERRLCALPLLPRWWPAEEEDQGAQ